MDNKFSKGSYLVLNERMLLAFHEAEAQDAVSRVPAITPTSVAAVNRTTARRARDRRLCDTSRVNEAARGRGKAPRCAAIANAQAG